MKKTKEAVEKALGRKMDKTELTIFEVAEHEANYEFKIVDGSLEAHPIKEVKIQAFQQRVIDEELELSMKLGKLKDFFDTDIFKSLPYDDRTLLKEQKRHMSNYRHVLKARIARF